MSSYSQNKRDPQSAIQGLKNKSWKGPIYSFTELFGRWLILWFWLQGKGRERVCSALPTSQRTQHSQAETIQGIPKLKQPLSFILDNNQNSNSNTKRGICECILHAECFIYIIQFNPYIKTGLRKHYWRVYAMELE